MSDAIELVLTMTADERAIGARPVHPGLYLIVACVAIGALWVSALAIRGAWALWTSRRDHRRALEAVEAATEPTDDAWPMEGLA